MKKTARALSLLLAVIMIFAVMAGCASKEEPAPAEESAPVEEAPAEEAPAEETAE